MDYRSNVIFARFSMIEVPLTANNYCKKLELFNCDYVPNPFYTYSIDKNLS